MILLFQDKNIKISWSIIRTEEFYDFWLYLLFAAFIDYEKVMDIFFDLVIRWIDRELFELLLSLRQATKNFWIMFSFNKLLFHLVLHGQLVFLYDV